jgi:hypothetical protein
MEGDRASQAAVSDAVRGEAGLKVSQLVFNMLTPKTGHRLGQNVL